METDDDTQSQDIIPASPPTYASHKTSKKCIPVVEIQEEEEGDEMEIQDYDDEDDNYKETETKEETPKIKNPKCNFNVVIDIDFSEDENMIEDADSPREVSKVSKTSVDVNCSIIEEGEMSLRSDDPFLNDDDDVDLMAEVEQIEKILEGGGRGGRQERGDDQGEVKGPSIFSVVDKQQLDLKEKERREEIDKMKRLGPEERIFPDVRASNFHTVAFFLKPNYKPGDDLLPHPPVFVSTWNSQYVPMPCANENIRIFKRRQQRSNGESSSSTNATSDNEKGKGPSTFTEEPIWMWERIEEALSLPIYCTQDIATAMKQYCRSSSPFRALNYCIDTLLSDSERDHFFKKVMPCMQTLCLDVSKIVTCPLPFLREFGNYSISLSQKQIAALLANAFFSTFPTRFQHELDYPSINFNELFQCPEDDDQNSRLVTKAHKIRCILYYFTRIAYEMPSGVVTYTRRSIRNAKAPDWPNSTKKLAKIIPLLEGTIEDDGAGMLQVDFANKVIGGGVLGGGAVQEEILFVIYPELILSRLFTERLTSCEALIVTGCERFSRYSGYARSFKFDGGFYDTTPCDSKGRKCTQIVGIDALYITRPVTQFHPRFLTRELNKSFVGFSSPTGSSVPVATGKWGCGAFNGNPQLKAVLQLLSASQSGRDVVFFTFGDVEIQKDIENMYAVIKDMTIQEVWNLLVQYNSLFCTSTTKPKYQLCEFLTNLKSFQNMPTSSNSLPSFSDCEEGSSSNGPENKKFKEVPITNFYSKETKPKSTNGGDSSRRGYDNLRKPGASSSLADTEVKDFQSEWTNNFEGLKMKAKSKNVISINGSSKAGEESRGDVTLSESQIGDMLVEESQDGGDLDQGLLTNYAPTPTPKPKSSNPFLKKVVDLNGEDDSKGNLSKKKEETKRLSLTDFYK